MLTKKTKNWLTKKKATPAEWRIYNIVWGFDQPFQNGFLLKHYKTSKTNIRQHLTRMIDKGLIVRHSYRTYLPAKPR